MAPLANPMSADHIAAEAGAFEPQRQNNFSVEIALGDADKDLLTLAIDGTAIPTVENEVVEIPFQNEKRKVAGQASVSDITLTIRDYVDADTRGAVLRWRKQVYDSLTGKIGLAKDYKKRGYLILTGPDGESTRTAKLIGCWPSSDVGGALSMGVSDPVMIELTVQVDKLSWSESITGA